MGSWVSQRAGFCAFLVDVPCVSVPQKDTLITTSLIAHHSMDLCDWPVYGFCYGTWSHRMERKKLNASNGRLFG
jgi:hypothetical protein